MRRQKQNRKSRKEQESAQQIVYESIRYEASTAFLLILGSVLRFVRSKGEARRGKRNHQHTN